MAIFFWWLIPSVDRVLRTCCLFRVDSNTIICDNRTSSSWYLELQHKTNSKNILTPVLKLVVFNFSTFLNEVQSLFVNFNIEPTMKTNIIGPNSANIYRIKFSFAGRFIIIRVYSMWYAVQLVMAFVIIFTRS